MAADARIGDGDLRTNFYDTIVKGVTEKTYKFKQALTIQSTQAWNNFFTREDPNVLTAGTDYSFEGVPRGSQFPRATPKWERIQKTILKYAAEDFIYWEDILSDDINIQVRVISKLAEAIAKQVDDRIWVDLGGTGTNADIQTFNITGRGWDEASATIVDDLMRAKQLIGTQYYPTDNLMVFISERDHRSMMKYFTDKGAQFPGISEKLLNKPNGMVGQMGAFTFIVSNSVTASSALIVVPQRCATWKELVPLQTTTITDDYIGVKVRAVEEGVVEVTDPKAIVRIQGTQSPSA